MHASMLRAFEKDPYWQSDPKFEPLQKIGASIKLFGYPGPPTQKAEEARSMFILVDMFAKAVQGTPTKEAIAWATAEFKKVYKE